MSQIELTVKETSDFLKYMINNNRFLQDKSKKPISVNLEGDAGLGKTSLCKQIAKEMKLTPILLSLAQLDELGDLLGFPVRQFELCKGSHALAEFTQEKKLVPKVVKKMVTENVPTQKQVMGPDQKLIMRTVMVPTQVEKEVTEMIEEVVTTQNPSVSAQGCMWVDEQAIDEYIKMGYQFTGNKRTVNAAPEWIADKTEPVLLILDDFSRAQARFMQAIMELIQNQEYMTWKLPEGSTIVLTSNPDDGTYHVESLDKAQLTRMANIKMKADVPCWGEWAEKEGIDGRCINFILLHPEIITDADRNVGVVNPRSVTTFFNAISSIQDFSQELPLIQMIGEGTIGGDAAMMFTQFINNKLDKLVSPKEILLNDNEAYIIGELRSCIGRGNDYRADIASILTTRLINFTVNYATTNSITQKVIDRLIKLATDPETLTDDLKYILIKKVLNGDKQKFQKLVNNQEVMKIAMK